MVEGQMTYNWPHDDTQSLLNYYGRPWEYAGLLTHVTPPFIIRYEGAPVHAVLIHKRCSDALAEVFANIWNHYGRDQSAIDNSSISRYSGSYNYRNVRGSINLSCHAFGAALDFDAEHNPLGATHSNMDPVVISAFKSVGAWWGGDFIHRKDNMHFQFATEA